MVFAAVMAWCAWSSHYEKLVGQSKSGPLHYVHLHTFDLTLALHVNLHSFSLSVLLCSQALYARLSALIHSFGICFLRCLWFLSMLIVSFFGISLFLFGLIFIPPVLSPFSRSLCLSVLLSFSFFHSPDVYDLLTAWHCSNVRQPLWCPLSLFCVGKCGGRRDCHAYFNKQHGISIAIKCDAARARLSPTASAPPLTPSHQSVLARHLSVAHSSKQNNGW